MLYLKLATMRLLLMLYLKLATMRLLLIQCAHITLLLHNTESLLSTHYITVLASESNTTNY